MSKRLTDLRALLASQRGLATEEDRVAWLNQNSYLPNETVGPSDWSLLLCGLSRRTAEQMMVGWSDAWFSVAFRLASTIPEDADDLLLGIAACAQAHAVGMRYEDVGSYARLIDGYRALYLEWMTLRAERSRNGDGLDDAGEDLTFPEFVSDRLREFETAMQYETDEGDEGDEPLASEYLGDPEVAVRGSALLWDAIDDYNDEMRQRSGDEADFDDIASFVLSIGFYLWACHHAKLRGIGRPELTKFVCQYPDDWRELMEELLRFDLLRPGVLEGFAETKGEATDVIERGVDLMLDYRRLQTDMTPTQYLDCVLAAVEQNA